MILIANKEFNNMTINIHTNINIKIYVIQIQT